MVDISGPPTVKSAMRTLDVIEYVVSRGEALAAQEIATALAIPVSSLSYLLSTLVERGYLARDGRRYSPGPGLARLQARTSEVSLIDRAAALVRTLRLQLSETSSFFVRRGWEVEALVTEESAHALRYAVRAGARAPMHSFAAGKALLAAMDDSELTQYFAQTTREKFTKATIYSEAGLRQEIARIRQDGIATTREEHTPGILGFARVARLDGEAAGAFSVAIPSVRFDNDVERRTREFLRLTSNLL